jgi:hypothetical protein
MSHSGEAPSPFRDQQASVDDWRGLGDLFGLSVERLIQPVEGMHRAIADRWLRLAGPAAAPLGRGYHAFATGVYGSVRLTGSVLASAVGIGAVAAGGHRQLPRLWSSPRGSGIRSIANAVWGDELERRRSPLSITAGLRNAAGESISVDSFSLARAFPQPTTRLAVLLHGLGETERCWLRETAAAGTVNGLGDVLEASSFTPLLARYNSGRRVSDSGADLAALLEEIVSYWPVAVEEVALVGSSMGGLVVRAAIHAGRAAGHSWVGLARNVVTIGAPHLGAPLEKGAHLITRGLRLTATTRPLGAFVNSRSAGVKDLRFGAIREEDWNGADPDSLLGAGFDDMPLPEGVEQHFVAAVVTADPTHSVGLLVGDLMVRVGSGTGRGRRRRIEANNVRVLGGCHHFRLLHDPDVHRQVQEWLTAGAS